MDEKEELPALEDIVAAFVSSQSRKRESGKESGPTHAQTHQVPADKGAQPSPKHTASNRLFPPVSSCWKIPG
jgi:hypothetical protein